MPRIDNNPIMKGARGMLGGVVVYRQFRGMTVMSKRPRKAKVITPHQQAIKSRFLLAVEYAKKQIADPVLKAKYEPVPGSKITSAYIAAITDYLRRAKQDERCLDNKKSSNNYSLHAAVGANGEIDKRGGKIGIVEYGGRVAEPSELKRRMSLDLNSYTVVQQYLLVRPSSPPLVRTSLQMCRSG